MYCEYLLKDALGGNQDAALSFFVANHSLLFKFASQMSVPQYDFADFCQLGWFAFQQALDKYELGTNFSFLAYYRRCMTHTLYLHNLSMRYPMKVNRDTYKYLGKHKEEIHFVSLDAYCEDEAYAKMDSEFIEVEVDMLCNSVWDCLKNIISEEDLKFLWFRYKLGYTYLELEKIYNKCSRTLNRRQASIFKKLRQSDEVRELARDFGIFDN